MSDWPYNSKLTLRARELRTKATNQENHLWYDYLRSYRPRFTRQRIVGDYILDFYCGKVKLAIEIDGSHHFEPKGMEYDKIRTEFLETLGIYVIRFTNLDIDRNFEGVCIAINEQVKVLNPRFCGPPPTPAAKAAPPSGEGGFEGALRKN